VEKLTKILNSTFHLRSQLDACNEYESSQSELYPISGSGSEINDKLIKEAIHFGGVVCNLQKIVLF
jgi:hypothetical protein